jgi:thymidylate synthase
MKQYQDAIRGILTEGTWQENRTGIDSIKMPYPIVMRFNMVDGFPALTGRRAAYKSAFGEIVGFIRGVTSAADFRALGCKFWDQNANENAAWLANAFRKGPDDLGDVYGAQWRRWPAYKFFERLPSDDIGKKLESAGWVYRGQTGENMSRDADDFKTEGYLWTKEIDQLADCVRTLIKNPNDRRILFHAWNPAKLDEIALPACHLLYQFVPCGKTLNLSLTLRSNDFPLGAPANIMEAALLLEIVARLTGFKPGYLTTMSNDAHIYRNQLDMVDEYLTRETYELPKLVIGDRVPTLERFQDEIAGQVHEPWYEDSLAKMAVGWLGHIEPEDFTLADYKHGEPLSAPMAV